MRISRNEELSVDLILTRKIEVSFEGVRRWDEEERDVTGR